MTIATATASTPHASRYLQQLCKHWAHKFAVEFTPEHGRIELPLGVCTLDADDKTLSVRLETAPGEDADRFETVLVKHLDRFAFREPLDLVFTRA